MDENQLELLDILKDILKVNTIIATELIQLVENSSAQLSGEIPGSCKTAHLELRKDIVRIAEKWSKGCEVLRSHNIRHE